jgi:hypothetical protein
MLFAPAYHALRNQALALDAAALGIATDTRVFGVLGEFGFPQGVATVVALADGTVSMYFSGGGGSLGLGQHEGPRKAAEALLREAPAALPLAAKDPGLPLPQAGEVRFWFLTNEGPVTAAATESELAAGTSPLTKLHGLLHDLLTQIRTTGPAKRN